MLPCGLVPARQVYGWLTCSWSVACLKCLVAAGGLRSRKMLTPLRGLRHADRPARGALLPSKDTTTAHGGSICKSETQQTGAVAHLISYRYASECYRILVGNLEATSPSIARRICVRELKCAIVHRGNGFKAAQLHIYSRTCFSLQPVQPVVPNELFSVSTRGL